MRCTKKVLPNGLRIIAVPMHDNETVTVAVMVEAGSKYETKRENGISHFLEHMCFKGSAKRPTPRQVSFEFDRIGAQNNAFTSDETTMYYGKAHARHFDTVLDLIADMYLDPTLPPEEIEKERGVIIEEIRMYEDLPQQKIGNVFNELLYGDQPAGRTIAGPIENIKRITRKDFVAYRDHFYTPSATVVAVAGGVAAGDVFKKVSALFGRMPKKPRGKKSPVHERQTKPAFAIHRKKTEQTHLILGVRAFDMYDPDRFALGVLATVLGQGMSSRLFHRLRDDLGMAYYVRAAADLSTDCGVMGVAAGVTLSRTEEAVKVILAELRRMRDELVPAAELKKAKDFKIGTMFLNLESSDSLAEFWGFSELFRQTMLSPDDIARRIRAVSAADVRRVARRIFSDTNLNLALLGPFSGGERFKKLLHF